jgi:hypothetical protein
VGNGNPAVSSEFSTLRSFAIAAGNTMALLNPPHAAGGPTVLGVPLKQASLITVREIPRSGTVEPSQLLTLGVNS